MKKFGFPKEDRIRKNAEYRNIYQNGKKIVDRYFVIYYKKNQLDKVRFGLSVSKKNGNAVIRNRLKRICREVFRLNKHKYPKGYDFVWVARRSMINLNSNQLAERIEKVLTKNKLLVKQ